MWLPVPETERTIASAAVKFPIYLQFIRQKLCIVFGEPPYNIKTDKRITKRLLKEAKPTVCKLSPLAEAMKYAEVLKEPSIVSKTQIAKMFGVSRARVCQMLNLLDLDYSIVNYLCTTKNSKEGNYFTERRLRPLTCLPKQEQLEVFKRFLRKIQLLEN
jgi:hypothetical protein